jgi:transcriptional regulator with XRE-family HTH domain
MEEKDVRTVFGENIKSFRNRRGWNQLLLAEKLDISANFLSELETGKGWVSPLTLAKLGNALEIDVFELFKAEFSAPSSQDQLAAKKMKRFVKDMQLAIDASTLEMNRILKNTVAKVCKEYSL